MSRLDELPPDERAALSLLLRQRKSYSDLARLLGIAEGAVHDRAHAALAVLAPRQARELTPEGRQEIGDYLLGQQAGVAERLRTRAYLEGSEPARAWARAVAAELAPLAGAELPEIPAGAAGQGQGIGERLASMRVGEHSASSPASPARSAPSSRLGGALLLGAIVAAVIVAVILLTGGSSSHNKTSASSASSTSSSSKARATTTGPAVTQRLALHSPNRRSRTVGAVAVVAEGEKRGFLIEAQHLPASRGFYYAIWLYSSPTSFLPLSKSPPVGRTHRLAGGAALPSNAGEFHEILLTRETSAHPTHPGPVVLRGPFSLGS